jgi:hypothetical protein
MRCIRISGSAETKSATLLVSTCMMYNLYR